MSFSGFICVFVNLLLNHDISLNQDRTLYRKYISNLSINGLWSCLVWHSNLKCKVRIWRLFIVALLMTFWVWVVVVYDVMVYTYGRVYCKMTWAWCQWRDGYLIVQGDVCIMYEWNPWWVRAIWRHCVTWANP